MFGILPKDLKAGMVVTIYEDPMTRTIIEGDAMLDKFVCKLNLAECWTVEFNSEIGTKYIRKILVGDSK